MKTLSEMTQEILKSKSSNARKKQALIQLGLREVDANNLIWMFTREERAQERTKRLADQIINSLTFGVEIECYSAIRTNIEERARVNNLNIRYEGYNHNDSRSTFRFVSDSSIRGANPIECVTPILKGRNGFSDLKKCCKTLNEAGCNVNLSTGLHVHIGGISSETQYVNVFRNYQALEGIIDSFMAFSRRNCQWCRPLSNYDFSRCSGQRDVYNVLNGRYYKVNPESWFRHNTIEFRQHAGTINFEKIKMWVVFCIKLVAWSKDNLITSEVTSIADVPFLNNEEKTYFQSRIDHFARIA